MKKQILSLLLLSMAATASCTTWVPTRTRALVYSTIKFKLEGDNYPRENTKAIVRAAWRRLHDELRPEVWRALGRNRLPVDADGWPDANALRRYTSNLLRMLPFDGDPDDPDGPGGLPPCYVYDRAGAHSCDACMPINFRFEIGRTRIQPYLSIHTIFERPRGPAPFGL